MVSIRRIGNADVVGAVRWRLLGGMENVRRLLGVGDFAVVWCRSLGRWLALSLARSRRARLEAVGGSQAT